MTFEEEIIWLLDEIEHDRKIALKGEPVEFEVRASIGAHHPNLLKQWLLLLAPARRPKGPWDGSEGPEGQVVERHIKLLKKLKELGVLEFKFSDKRYLFLLTINNEKFSETYKTFKLETPTSLKQAIPKDKRVKLKDIKYTFPFKLRAGTKWENVIIKFLDDENIQILVKGHDYRENCYKMGFKDSRNKLSKPNHQWSFLKILSIFGGEITIQDSVANKKYKKAKEKLSKALQTYFRIDYDPFYPYHDYIKGKKSANSYKIRITLLPSPDFPSYDNIKLPNKPEDLL